MMDILGLGGGGMIIEIKVNPDAKAVSLQNIVPLDHAPTWKTRKNPFLALPYRRKGFISQSPSAQSMQQHIESRKSGQTNAKIENDELFYAYGADQPIEGEVILWLPPGKRYEHLGIKIQFLGRIDLTHLSQDFHYDFVSLVKELAPPGILNQTTTVIPFHFRNVEKQYDTYHGCNVFVRYFIRVHVERKFFTPMEKDREVFIRLCSVPPSINSPIKMEVGIEDCLHIEFEFDKQHYHLQDVIIGKIDFVLVKIRLKYMEVALMRREMSGSSAAIYGNSNNETNDSVGDLSQDLIVESQTLVRFEVMDGQPIKGETIPVRLYLKGIAGDLTPTYESVNNRFSVRYFLNLVLVDEEDRRYFKQSEVFLWRKDIG